LGRSIAKSPQAMLPDELGKRLREFAAKEDDLMIPDCKAAQGRHKRSTEVGSRLQRMDARLVRDVLPRPLRANRPQRVSRLARCFRGRVSKLPPEEDVDAWPMTFGHVISAQLGPID
jgi:hypothetical protein